MKYNFVVGTNKHHNYRIEHYYVLMLILFSYCTWEIILFHIYQVPMTVSSYLKYNPISFIRVLQIALGTSRCNYSCKSIDN